MSLKKLNDIHKLKEKYIQEKLKELDKEVIQAQDELMKMLMSKFAGEISIIDGVIMFNPKNVSLIYELEKIITEFEQTFQADLIKNFGVDLLKITWYNEKYYSALEFKEKTIKSVFDKMQAVHKSIGINQKGNIIKGSYIDNLTTIPEVRKQIKDYVVKSVVGKKDYKTFVTEFHDLIVGNDEVDGRLQRYYKQYVNDVMNEYDAAENLYAADNLGLNYFIYAGSEIDTTREFCSERLGLVWSREEAESWQDMDWTGKKDGDFFINRGGYNCRHHLKWISEELAKMLRPDLQ